MSYAGPAARAKRALEMAAPTSAPGSAGATGPARQQRPSPSRFDAYRRAASGRSAAFVAGVTLGAVLGAGIALILAPQSGVETRHDIVRQGRRATKRSRDAWDDLRDELQRAASRRWRRFRRTETT